MDMQFFQTHRYKEEGAMNDILLINAKYPDFAAQEIKFGNIAIKDGKIIYIGEGEPVAREVIDVEENIVSPGFIDIHMHEEDFVNEGYKYIISNMMLSMGVTTAVGGNCGIQRQKISEFRHGISRLGGSPINYIMLAGYNQCRYKLGIESFESASKYQNAKIRDMLAQEIKDGAFGVSFGIEYDPGISTDEIIKALNILTGPNMFSAAHYRADNDGAIESINEMIHISNCIDGKFQISHLSSCSAMGQMREALDIIHKAIDLNPGLNYDTYPFNALSTHIGSTVFYDGCLNAWHRDYCDIMLTEEPYKYQFCDKEIFHDARKNYPNMLAVAFVMNEEEIEMTVSDSYGMIASDAIINGGKGHPRAAGTFPRVLGKYVREDKKLSLIEALRKMTITPAERLGLSSKGIIREGADADVCIFDPNTVKDNATYEDGSIPPSGIEYVLVNGKVALRHGKIQDDNYGAFIPFRELC